MDRTDEVWDAVLREPCEVAALAVKFEHGFGFAARRRAGVQLLGENTLLTIVGCAALVFDFKTNSFQFVFCPDDNGVASIAVHPKRAFFALGGRGVKPNVYIYSFPGLELLKVLRNGTETAYSCMCFNSAGDKLATVGAKPDFLLTVWDWEEEQIILRNKAFSQDVYKVAFAHGKDGLLTTSGQGHVRFWRMAETFTGLKLQGDIGKFGKFELSDISAFAMMPDGKVLSGSESGSLLLWDGNFIKLEVRREGNCLPHEGEVLVCLHLIESREFLTAGVDGWIRWWPFDEIQSAETLDDQSSFIVSPNREINFSGVVPMEICFEENLMVIQDRNGTIFKVQMDQSAFVKEPLLEGHAQGISGLGMSSNEHLAVTAGMDGSVRVWNYLARMELCRRIFTSSATCVAWLSLGVQFPGNRGILVGFADGLLRHLFVGESGGLILCDVLKPHNCRIVDVKIHAAAHRCATCAEDGTIFLFDLNDEGKLVPIGFFTTPEPANCLAWNSSGKKLLIGCNQGLVLEVSVPGRNTDSINTSKTFDITKAVEKRIFHYRRNLPKPRSITPPPIDETSNTGSSFSLTTDQRQGPDEQENPQQEEYDRLMALEIGNVIALEVFEEVEEEPLQFAISLDGNDAGPIHVCAFGEAFPIKSLPNSFADDGEPCPGVLDFVNVDIFKAFLPGQGRISLSTFISKSASGNFLLSGSGDGTIRLRPSQISKAYGVLKAHDGPITGAACSFDDSYVLTCGSDGALFVYSFKAGEFAELCADLAESRVDRITAKEQYETGGLAGHRARGKPVMSCASLCIVERGLNEVIDPESALQSDLVNDISDPAHYSIQDEKLKAAHEEKLRLAFIEKEKVREVIEQLRRDFSQILHENEIDQSETRLSREAFDIDPFMITRLREDGLRLLEEVSKETEWDVRQWKAKLAKLKGFLVDDVETNSISISGFENGLSVETIRSCKLSSELSALILEAEQKFHESRRLEVNSSTDSQSNISREDSDLNVNSPTGKKRNSSASVDAENSHGWEARLQGRQARREQMEKLISQKPDEKNEEQNDVAAIGWELKHMGDYKLKTSKEYEVPHGQLLNADTKFSQRILLAQKIKRIEREFNVKCMDLRENKKEIVGSARRDFRRVQQINKELGETPEEEIVFPLELDCSEWPKDRFNAAKSSNSQDFDAFSVDPIQDNNNSESESYKPILQVGRSRNLSFSPAKRFQDRSMRRITLDATARFELEILDARQKLLRFERDTLIQRTHSAVRGFDASLYDLRLERGRINLKLCLAQLRMIELYRENNVLDEFQSKDEGLKIKLEECKLQQSEVHREISNHHKILTSKSAELESFKVKLRSVEEEFLDVVKKKAPAYLAPLSKIFRRKIKRAKAKTERSGSENGLDEGISDSDDEDYDDEEYDEELGQDGEPEEEKCPDGCDVKIFDEVVQMREKRLDAEDIVIEKTKELEGIRKACDRHQGRQKQIEKDLKSTLAEIQAFQNEKQRALNELNRVVLLSADRIACLVDPDGDSGKEEEFDGGAEFSDANFQEDASIDGESKDIEEAKVKLCALRQEIQQNEEMAAELDDPSEVIGNAEKFEQQAKELVESVILLRAKARKARRKRERLVLPRNISEALLFDKDALKDLHGGIACLLREIEEKKEEYQELHVTQKRLARDKKQKLGDINALKTKCKEIQLLKFGQEIDLDAVEEATRKVRNEPKETFAQSSKEAHQQRAAKLERKIAKQKAALLKTIQANSALLEELAKLTETQQKLESDLNGAESGSVVAPGISTHREVQETARLTRLIKLQGKEIDSLKAEIAVLKGGTSQGRCE